MTETSQIRTSLLKIRESQSSLLKQLRSEHDALQGYITSNIDFAENLNEFRPNGVGFCNDYRSYDSSLQFTKSEGNVAGYQTYGYGSTSAGGDDVLENNYKKIQDLLVKQRKLYEQNHALQEENQSLIEDYRSMKSLFYEQKQTNADHLVLSAQIFSIVYQVIQNALLQLHNSQILAMAKKGWERFVSKNERLFQQSAGNYSEECQSYLNRVFMLLDQEFKVNTIKNKDSQIQQLKSEVKALIEGSGQREKQMEREKGRLEEVLLENRKLTNYVDELKRKMLDCERESTDRIQKIEAQIMQKKRQVSEFTALLLKKNDEIDQIKKSSHNLKSYVGVSEMEQAMAETKLNEVSKELMKKQQLYQQQVEVCKKQNQVIERMNIDLSGLQKELQGLGMRRGENENRLLIENEGLMRELNGLKIEFGRYRQNSQREINLLKFQNNQIRNQHHLLIRSEENARLNEQRAREVSVGRVSSIKLSANIGHLWSVKEIEYENILKILTEER